jgi:ubiquinone/menaquinone biosynthesis C-methylase UbiE
MGATAHLGIKFNEYDAVIASLIPHYKPLIEAAAEAVDVAARMAPAVVDLGTGSGALAAEILKVRPKARLIGIDADSSMLEAAQRRLKGRIDIVQDDFERARIPRCDVVSASFSLHHIDAGRKKGALYKRCFAALRDGGMFVSADCFLATDGQLRRRHRQAWLEHLQKKYTKKKAEQFLRTWAKEDVYFSLEREMDLLKDAGFSVEVTWRRDSFAVLVGLK